MLTKLSGKRVEVELIGSVGLGNIDGNRLYGPGRAVVPIELARGLGKQFKEEDVIEPEAVSAGEVSALQTAVDAGGTDRAQKFTVKLGSETLTLGATEPSVGFPKAEGDINDKTVAELEAEIAYRNIDLPDGKGSGANGNYVKQDLVTVLAGTTPKES